MFGEAFWGVFFAFCACPPPFRVRPATAALPLGQPGPRNLALSRACVGVNFRPLDGSKQKSQKAKKAKKPKRMGDGIATVRESGVFYRVLTRVARQPLRVSLATCVVSKFPGVEGGMRRLLLEISDDAHKQYVRLRDIQLTFQQAVEDEERKCGLVAAIRPLVRPPIGLPGSPRMWVSCVGATRYFVREGESAKPVAATDAELVGGARVHVQLELVGLRRDDEMRWHYDVVAAQIMVVRDPPAPTPPAEEPCLLIVDDTEADEWETGSVAPEAEHPMLSAALADDEGPVIRAKAT